MAPERAAASPRRAVGVAGHLGDCVAARAGLNDGDEVVRAAAISAVARAGCLELADLVRALSDPSDRVRRRGCDVAGRQKLDGSGSYVLACLADPAPTVVEAACHALGELADVLGEGGGDVVMALALVASAAREPACREAAVAALGALGRPEGLGAVLGALADKPAVRRRAVVALAAFEGGEVDDALLKATSDPDWQVRQVAEDLTGARPRAKTASAPGAPLGSPGRERPPSAGCR